jgi:hypothetical protein
MPSVEPTVVHVPSWRAWGTLVGGTILIAIGLLGLSVTLKHDTSGVSTGDLLGSLAIGAVAVFFLAMGVLGGRRAVRHLHSKLPVLQLDADGLECAYGRVHWGSVESVERMSNGDDAASIRVIFQQGTAWFPVVTGYSTYLLEGKRDDGFVMKYWAKGCDVRETLGRYYEGPITV